MTITIPDYHNFSESGLTEDGYREKHRTRLFTLELLKRSDYWNPMGGYLVGDWLELCGGPADETLKMLLQANALCPGRSRYVGINSDPDVIASNQEVYAEATAAGLAVWVHDRWENAVYDRAAYPRARVLVFDSTNSMRNGYLDDIRDATLNFAEYLYNMNGTCLAVLNFSTIGTTQEREQEHKDFLMQWKIARNPSDTLPVKFHRYCSRTKDMLLAWVPLGLCGRKDKLWEENLYEWNP